jgi:thioesterase domain-containing protein/acyl carrier protein
LGLDKDIISIDADFFQVGGHSLKATALASRMQETFNVVVPLVEIFTKPAIKTLAEYIRAAETTALEIGRPAAADENLVLLKPGPENARRLFLIHDGSGEVEGYMDFCKGLTHPFNCWGLRAHRPENPAPRNCTIEEIAQSYIEKIRELQPQGPYWIVGWSLGGTIAFEMAVKLEKMGVEVAFLGLIDSSGPRPVSTEEVENFTLQSEVEWVWEYLPDEKIKEKIKKAGNTNETWSFIVNHLEENHVSVELVKRLIPHQLAQIIPNYRQLGTRELIYHLNINRTLARARDLYLPAEKIHTTLHYFKAGRSPGTPRDNWNDYCIEPIKSVEIPGDHFSILDKTGVDQTIKMFESIFQEMT